MRVRAQAPGKLILSGEHAVVYGQPALAMAINCYARAVITRESLPQILLDLSDLAHRRRLSLAALQQIKARIKRKYQRFIRGDFSVREVLQKPFELAQVALGIFVEAFNLSIPHGIKIQVQSDIPIGCGLGSSAATILSVMTAIATYLQIPLSPQLLYQLAIEAENMQHGHSSGLDLQVSLQGGCVFMHGNTIQKRALPVMPMYLVNTGTPLTATGQCVEQAARHFQSPQLQTDFAAVTTAMDQALTQKFSPDVQTIIRENHQLLVRIGVVPEKVQQFIAAISAANGAGKICGAGAVAGDQAGAVLVVGEADSAMSAICARFGYHLLPITGESRGAHAI